MLDTSDSHRGSGRRRITIPAIAVLAIAVCFLIVPVAAHTPTAMDISFDPSTAKISVTITHPVDDPTTHYLKTIQVKLNGNVISDPDYKSQLTKDTFTMTYDVNANPGDTVWVTATCNRGGTLEKSYVPLRQGTPVPTQTPATAPPTASPTTKATLGLLPLLGAAAVLMIKR